MASGYADDSSNDGVLIENPYSEPEGWEDESDDSIGTEAPALTASSVEEHDGDADKFRERGRTRDENELNKADSQVNPEVGAGLLFGLSGLVLGGPVLAALAGAGAVYAAEQDVGPVGDAARASGELAVSAGSRLGMAAKETNEKHGILEKIQDALRHGWSKVRRFEEEYRAMERVKEKMSDATEKLKGTTERMKEKTSDVTLKTVEFERKHHVVENILKGIQNGLNFLLEKIGDDPAPRGNERNDKRAIDTDARPSE